MTVEEFYVQYLNGALPDVETFGDVPSPLPDTFITVERVGGGQTDEIPRADIAVQSWGPTRAAAGQLNERVKAAMLASIARPEISRCHLDTDYNFTDTTTNHPRYQAVFEAVYFLQ